jgi:glycosyltransferase involved in cell wall biosynthesis
MSMAKPVVFASLGPGPETIEHGVDGLLCNPFDPADIAAQIALILADPDYGEALGKKGREKVLAKYDIGPVTEKNMAFYQEIIFSNQT